jgi:ABC-type methionine transport system permease subunit
MTKGLSLLTDASAATASSKFFTAVSKIVFAASKVSKALMTVPSSAIETFNALANTNAIVLCERAVDL